MIRSQLNVNSPVRLKLPFNATPWFSQATESELKSLAVAQWRCDSQVSVGVLCVVAMHDDRLAKVLAALAKSGQRIQFTCTVNETHANAWLQRYRPDVVQAKPAPNEVRLPLKRYLSR